MYLVSKPFLTFLGANQDGVLRSRRTSLTQLPIAVAGGDSLRLAANIDLIAGPKDKPTDITIRLNHQHIDVAWK